MTVLLLGWGKALETMRFRGLSSQEERSWYILLYIDSQEQLKLKNGKLYKEAELEMCFDSLNTDGGTPVLQGAEAGQSPLRDIG